MYTLLSKAVAMTPALKLNAAIDSNNLPGNITGFVG
jgi:hypothetical protein